MKPTTSELRAEWLTRRWQPGEAERTWRDSREASIAHLCDEVDRLRAENERLRDALGKIQYEAIRATNPVGSPFIRCKTIERLCEEALNNER